MIFIHVFNNLDICAMLHDAKQIPVSLDGRADRTRVAFRDHQAERARLKCLNRGLNGFR